MSATAEEQARSRAEMAALAEHMAQTGEGPFNAAKSLGLTRNRVDWLWRRIKREVGAQAV